MKKSKAISRAFERLDTPSLSYDFNARLMARVRERAREQRRTDIIMGIFAIAAIIAMVAYGVSTMIAIKFPPIKIGAIFNHLIPSHMRLWGAIILSLVAMMVVDMYIRQYFRLRKQRRQTKQ